MSKPNKPGELRDVEVNAVSLVNKAANGERFKIFKSDKSGEEAPEVIEKNEQGLFSVLKKFFTGSEEVEKGAVSKVFDAREHGMKLNKAFDALCAVLKLNRWSDGPNEEPEASPAKIRAALEDFKNVAEKILLGSDEEVKKAVEDVQKSGRKISGSRLSKIKEVHAILGDLIADADTEEDKGGNTEVTKEELTLEVKKSVDEALKPISERLKALEKSEAEAEVKKEAEAEQPDMNEVVKNALDEALKPITERLERVEKARGFSNRQPEDVNVNKSSSSLWDGAFGY